MKKLQFEPYLDSIELADLRRRELALRPEIAESLGRSAVAAIDDGFYLTDAGQVDWAAAVQAAKSNKVSIPPEAELPTPANNPVGDGSGVTSVLVSNETTLRAGLRLHEAGLRPLALNFANGVQPGGGFLYGATAQEEALCRSSALFATLLDDPMYDFHREHDPTASSDWAILSPDVPVFRDDAGLESDQPWPLSFLTCAAPYAPAMQPNRAAELLRGRIHRVLGIARAYGYQSLVLGAWGCGAFGNDTLNTAQDFREALEDEFRGCFSRVIFAITDWSDERRTLGPFRDVFSDV